MRTLQDDERPLEVAEEYTESVDIDGDSEKRKSSRKSGKPARMRVKFIYKVEAFSFTSSEAQAFRSRKPLKL